MTLPSTVPTANCFSGSRRNAFGAVRVRPHRPGREDSRGTNQARNASLHAWRAGPVDAVLLQGGEVLCRDIQLRASMISAWGTLLLRDGAVLHLHVPPLSMYRDCGRGHFCYGFERANRRRSEDPDWEAGSARHANLCGIGGRAARRRLEPRPDSCELPTPFRRGHPGLSRLL